MCECNYKLLICVDCRMVWIVRLPEEEGDFSPPEECLNCGIKLNLVPSANDPHINMAMQSMAHSFYERECKGC